MTRNPLVRVAAAALKAVALIAFLYVAAGLIGGAIPANIGWEQPGEGITIYVEDNGIHTGIVLPKAALAPEWLARFAAGDLRDPRYAGHPFVAIGWGDRAFYLETPRWADVRPATVLRAAIGSDETVLHVEHVAQPRGSESVKAVRLAPEQFARLQAFLRATLAEGAPAPGYGAHDAFYPAHGRYTAIRTCNAWTGEALRAAGVRQGLWTPFSGSVMRWL